MSATLVCRTEFHDAVCDLILKSLSHEVSAMRTFLLIGIIGTALPVFAQTPDEDARQVWEYKGGFGVSWFVHEGSGKWVIYRGDGQTFLYKEEKRTPTHIELRGPYTKLLIRLSQDRFETRRAADKPSRRSAGGKWVSRQNLPQHIREAPKGYQIRLVYFVPPDREPAPEYAARIRLIVNMVAELLHDDLRSVSFRPKPIEFESRDGEMLVHLVRAAQPASFYRVAKHVSMVPNRLVWLVSRKYNNARQVA